MIKDKDKKEFGYWWIFLLGMLVIAIIVLSFTGYLGKWTSTIVERKVFEESYQRSEGLKSREATYKAQLAMINQKLAQENDPEVLNNLKAQKAMLEVQLMTVANEK